MEAPSRQRVLAGSACALVLGTIGYFGNAHVHQGSARESSTKSATKPKISQSPLPKTNHIEADGIVRLNQASLEELQQLPGVGPVIAQHILDFRKENGNFKSIDELQEVSGIGEKLFAKIKGRVSL